MGEDARQSLRALVVVSLVFGSFYFAMQLLDRVELPRWFPAAGLALNTLVLAWHLVARWRRRRREAAAER